MYYIIAWREDRFLVYHADTTRVSDIACTTLLESIKSFSIDSWDITTQLLRFKFTDTELLEYNHTGTELLRSHPILHKFPSIELSYLQQYYPELLI